MKKLYIFFISCLLSLSVQAENFCPDGQFDAQSSVCICPGGHLVPLNTSCEKGVHLRWGAIAFDLQNFQAKGFAWSDTNQDEANDQAIRACNDKNCRLVLSSRNACGALAIQPNGNAWGKGIGDRPMAAEYQALQDCNQKSTTACQILLPGSCAIDPDS